MNYEWVVTVIVPIVVAIITSGGVWGFLERKNARKKNTELLIMGLARSTIIKECEYYIHKECISSQEYDDIILYLYDPYTQLGGNGLAKRLVNEISNLPSPEE